MLFNKKLMGKGYQLRMYLIRGIITQRQGTFLHQSRRAKVLERRQYETMRWHINKRFSIALSFLLVCVCNKIPINLFKHKGVY
jgi:hypothetical protein